MVNLQDLATKLLYSILAYIQDMLNKQDMLTFYSISLVLKFFHKLSQPFLYGQFINSYSLSTTYSFTRTIIEWPDLAVYVKHLDLTIKTAPPPINIVWKDPPPDFIEPKYVVPSDKQYEVFE
jgi:hypothetical protein